MKLEPDSLGSLLTIANESSMKIAAQRCSSSHRAEADRVHLRVFAEPGLLVVTGRHRPEEVPVVDRHLDGRSGLQGEIRSSGGVLLLT